MNHRIFERTLRPLAFRGACLFERHYTTQAWLGIGGRGPPRLLMSPAESSVSERCESSIRFRVQAARAVKPLFQVDLGSGRDTR